MQVFEALVNVPKLPGSIGRVWVQGPSSRYRVDMDVYPEPIAET